jgi:hypothetical protein
MPQTRMFRDRVVSMEQTLEGGEKNLEVLKSLCREAFPDFEYREHALDHERDLFVMALEAADGRRRNVGWTRMVLFDPERIPALSEDAAHAIRGRVVAFLKSRATRSEIIVTFRHLEEGWVDTPEPRRERKRGRRGRGADRGGRPHLPGGGEPARGGGPAPGQQRQGGGRPRPGGPPPVGEGRPPQGPRSGPGGEKPAAAEAAKTDGQRPSGGRRRRFRRRRRGRGGSGSGAPPTSPPAGTP